MDIDIRKQSRHGKVDIHRPHQGSSAGGSTNPSPVTDSPRSEDREVYHEPVSDGELNACKLLKEAHTLMLFILSDDRRGRRGDLHEDGHELGRD
jgi:hypothetical protein